MESRIFNGNLTAWTFAGNVWSPQAPPFAAADEVKDLSGWGAPMTAASVESHAAEAGRGQATSLATDYFCRPRSPSSPTRGAVEE